MESIAVIYDWEDLGIRRTQDPWYGGTVPELHLRINGRSMCGLNAFSLDPDIPEAELPLCRVCFGPGHAFIHRNYAEIWRD